MKSFIGEPVITKIGWSAFAVIYAALALYRWDDLYFGTTQVWYSNLGWAYLAIAVLSVIMIVAGKEIIRRQDKQNRLVGRADALRTQLAKQEEKLREASNALAASDTDINRAWVKREKKRVSHVERLVRKAEKGE